MFHKFSLLSGALLILMFAVALVVIINGDLNI